MIKAKKILFLGEISPGQTSHMRMQAFQRLGYEVCGVNTNAPWMRVPWLIRRLQRGLQQGSVVDEINQSAISAAQDFRPDLIWAEKQEFLTIDTIEELRQLKARLVHFTPDPYFSLEWKRTRLMDRAMGAFDVLVYCKRYEQPDYEAVGKPLIYMPLGYCDRVHRPLPSADINWACSVGFLGGWEPRRETLLHAVAATGVDLKIWGGYWDFLCDGKRSLRRQIILSQLAGKDRWQFHRDLLLANSHQGGEVYGDDYARALTGAKIGLGFLRQVCPDQHTTRTFEIPACGSMLLADRTEEHQEFFVEGKEAEFYDSSAELVDKVKYYTDNESARDRIAAAGHQRCSDSRYAYIHRLSDVLAQMEKRELR
jgi:spore maturation protein CgeB